MNREGDTRHVSDTSAQPSGSPPEETLRHSELGVASFVVAMLLLILLVSLLVVSAVAGEVNRVHLYLYAVPFLAFSIGGPVGVLLGIGGLFQPMRRRTYTKLGLALSLVLPLVWAVVFLT